MNPIKNGSTAERSGGRYLVQSAEKPWSFSQTSNLDRFEVRGGDTWLNESPTNPTNRAELRRLETHPYGTDVWLSFGLVIDSDPLTGWALFGQFHATPDAGDTGLSPVWALEAWQGYLQVRTRSSSSETTMAAETSTVHFKTPCIPGERVRFVFRLRFERGTGGHMQAWRDGVEVFNAPVMIGYNDAAGPYFKYGVYRQESAATTIATYADVTVSSTPLPI